MSQEVISSSQAVSDLPGFLKQMAGLSVTMIAFVLLVTYVHLLHSMWGYVVSYSPVFAITAYFSWLRSFHPNRVPAMLAPNSLQYRRLKWIGVICLLSAMGLAAALVAVLSLDCFCQNEWFAAHTELLLAGTQTLFYGALAASLGIFFYLKERREKPTVPPDLEVRRQHGPHLELYGFSGQDETKSFQSEHWGRR